MTLDLIFRLAQLLIVLFAVIAIAAFLLRYALNEWRAAKSLKNPTYDIFYANLSPIMSVIDSRTNKVANAIMYTGKNAGDVANFICEQNYYVADMFLDSVLDNKPIAVAGQYLVLQDNTFTVVDGEEFDNQYFLKSWRTGATNPREDI